MLGMTPLHASANIFVVSKTTVVEPTPITSGRVASMRRAVPATSSRSAAASMHVTACPCLSNIAAMYKIPNGAEL